MSGQGSPMSGQGSPMSGQGSWMSAVRVVNNGYTGQRQMLKEVNCDGYGWVPKGVMGWPIGVKGCPIGVRGAPGQP